MTFSTDLAKLTPAEMNALNTHLRYAGDESFATHGGTDTVRELDFVARTVKSAMSNVLGTGRKPKTPDTPLDHADIAHEAIFGALTQDERHALAVHMVHAMEESAHAGVPTEMQFDLVTLAYDTDYAATANITGSGLVMGRTARRPLRSLVIGSPTGG